MKMAKANENDLQMAMDLCGAFDALTQRFGQSMPEAIQNCGPEDCEHFDRDNDEQCGRALRHLIDIANRGSLMRVVWGMAVLLDPSNEMVDPAADTLEHHPDRVAAEAQLAALREGLEGLIKECMDDSECSVNPTYFALQIQSLLTQTAPTVNSAEAVNGGENGGEV